MSQQPSLTWLAKKIVYFIAFWIIALIVLMYAAGFRVNWQSGRLIESSSVALSTINNKKIAVTYTLNGEAKTANLPVLINYLTPGAYTLTVESEGKISWQKSFRVEATDAASFDNLLLLPVIIPVRPATTDESASLAKVEKLVSAGLLIRNNELYDTRKKVEKLLVRMSQPIEQAIWYPKEKHIIIRSGQTVSLMETDGTNITKLFTLDSARPVKMVVLGGGQTLVVESDHGPLSYDLY